MGKYDPWRSLFTKPRSEDFVLGISQLESMLGSQLPPSARTYQAWWGSGHTQAVWIEYGFVARPSLGSGTVRFQRKGKPQEKPYTSTPPKALTEAKRSLAGEPITGSRLVLVGCVKTKRTRPSAAKDLYNSPLWEKRRRYAESSRMPWAILSAEHGLLDPDAVIVPYDRYLGDEPPAYKRAWSARLAGQVLERLSDLGLSAVEIHAGSAYVENGLATRLASQGVDVSWPVQGLAIGQQLGWYR